MEHVTGRNLKGGNTEHLERERGGGGGRKDGKGRVLRQRKESSRGGEGD